MDGFAIPTLLNPQNTTGKLLTVLSLIADAEETEVGG